MRRAITTAAIAMKLLWFRVLCYGLLPAWATFAILTDKITGEQWMAMHAFDRFKIYGACVAAGLLNLVAFIDNAAGKVRQEVQEKAAAENEKIKLA